MKIDELQTFQQVIAHLDKKQRTRHLLLGNGFSMAYDREIFSYNALAKFIDDINDELLKKLFEIVNNKNFEIVMQQLNNFIEIAKVFSVDPELVTRLETAGNTLKKSLIEAVKALHPEHVFKIPREKSEKCAAFLRLFLDRGGKIFTTNYDLLLYWVVMRNRLDSKDGFGKEFEGFNPKTSEADFADLAWGKYKDDQEIFYLHGALHLFDTGVEIEKEIYDSGHYLLDKIKGRIARQDYPIFVAAGNGRDKMTHITHNKYLQHGFDSFSQIAGSLVVFGFGFGESDTHIIDSINRAAEYGRKTGRRLWSVYIGVNSQDGLDRMERIKDKFKMKVNFYNSHTAGVWE